MIISIFLAWTQGVQIYTGKTFNVTGLDLISGKFSDAKDVSYVFLAKAPLLVLIFGIITLILAALPLFKVNMPAITIIGAIAALVGLIFAILFLTVGGTFDIFGDDKGAIRLLFALNEMKIQFGAYLGLIGALVATVGGVLNVIPMFKK